MKRSYQWPTYQPTSEQVSTVELRSLEVPRETKKALKIFTLLFTFTSFLQFLEDEFSSGCHISDDVSYDKFI